MRPPGDTLAAQATLHEVLTTLALAAGSLLPLRRRRHVAPAHRGGRGRVGPPGRLAGGRPVAGSTADLEAQMALARRLTSLGRAARSEAVVKVRQPLDAGPGLPPGRTRRRSCDDIVADELNVDEIDVADELSDVLQFELVPNFKTLGSAPGRAGQRAQAGAGRARRRRRCGRHWKPGGPSPSRWEASRSSCRPRTCSCGSGASRVSPCPARAARWWRSTSTSTTACASEAWPATSCGWCRTCARPAGSRSPTASTSRGGPRAIAGFFDYIAREVLAVEIADRARARGRAPCSSSTTTSSPSRCGCGSSESTRPPEPVGQRRGSPGSSDPLSATWTPPVAAGSSTTRSASVRIRATPAPARAAAASPRSSTRSAIRCVHARSYARPQRVGSSASSSR